MLKNIPTLLSPDLLYVLSAMGHGDEIAIVDANYPAESRGRKCIRMDGVSATEVLRAVLTVMPLDEFVPDPAICMEVVGNAAHIPDAVISFQETIDKIMDNPVRICSLERFAFYDRAAGAFAIVQTGESRLYGNIILKKGVIRPADNAG